MRTLDIDRLNAVLATGPKQPWVLRGERSASIRTFVAMVDGREIEWTRVWLLRGDLADVDEDDNGEQATAAPETPGLMFVRDD